MKLKLARVNCFYIVAATITKQMIHDFNLKSTETRSIKKQSFYGPIIRNFELFTQPDIFPNKTPKPIIPKDWMFLYS